MEVSIPHTEPLMCAKTLSVLPGSPLVHMLQPAEDRLCDEMLGRLCRKILNMGTWRSLAKTSMRPPAIVIESVWHHIIADTMVRIEFLHPSSILVVEAGVTLTISVITD